MGNHDGSGKSIASICLHYVLNIEFILSSLFQLSNIRNFKKHISYVSRLHPRPLKSTCATVSAWLLMHFRIELPDSENEHPNILSGSNVQQSIYRTAFTPMGSGNYIHFLVTSCYHSLCPAKLTFSITQPSRTCQLRQYTNFGNPP
jgi:hypothetical protein